METLKDLPVLLFKSQPDWHEWLGKNHGQQQGAWIKIAKKNSGVMSVTYAEALDEALCYGWIDGQLQRYDDQYYLQKFTPRRPRSVWSKVNIAKVEVLTKNGQMHPSGLAAIEQAKQNGEYDRAYDSASSMSVPEDFQAALDSSPTAKKFFLSLNRANTYAFTWRIQTAKTPQLRQSRIEKFIEMLQNSEKFH